MDEPTNDLDIDTLNVLEEFLENFPGVLMLVSHDRYLLDKMSEQLFIMEGNGVVNIYNGNYSEYRTSLEVEKTKETKTPKAVETKAAPVSTKKLSYKEQKELEDAEVNIARLEKKIEVLAESLLEIDSADYVKLQEVNKTIEADQQELDSLTERWLELSEKIS